eukprot:COSAG02_NODE_316_length_24889_cov_9.418556_15_plen_452_part_00
MLLPLLHVLLVAAAGVGTRAPEPLWIRKLGGKQSLDLLHLALPSRSGEPPMVLVHQSLEDGGGKLHGLGMANGGLVWQMYVNDTVIFYKQGTLRFSTDGADVYTTVGNTTRGVDAASGGLWWIFDHGAPPLLTSLSDDGFYLYVISGAWFGNSVATLTKLNAQSGSLQWKLTLPTGISVIGGLATAAADTVVLLYGQEGTLDNVLVALDAETGTLWQWSRGTDQQLAAVEPLLLSDDTETIYVCLAEFDGDAVHQTLHSLHAATGAEHWQLSTHGAISKLVVSHDGRTLVFVDLETTAVAASLNLVDVVSGITTARWPLPEYDFLFVGVSDDNSMAFFQRTSSDQNHSSCVAAIETRTGQLSWSACRTAPNEFTSLESAALSSDGAVLLVCFGELALEALDLRSGAVLWSISTGGNAIEVPLSIVAARANATTFFGAGSSVLAVLDETLTP